MALVSVTVLAESIGQFGFSVLVSDLNQKSGFGRTLDRSSGKADIVFSIPGKAQPHKTQLSPPTHYNAGSVNGQHSASVIRSEPSKAKQRGLYRIPLKRSSEIMHLMLG